MNRDMTVAATALLQAAGYGVVLDALAQWVLEQLEHAYGARRAAYDVLLATIQAARVTAAQVGQ